MANTVFYNKGVQIGPESHTLNESPGIEPGYKAFKLNTRARGRQTLSDGMEITSSISLSNRGQYYTEVFSLPVPAGTYFYHKDNDITEESTLLFNTASSDTLTVSVFYETRGSKIKAELFNVYNYGTGTFDGVGQITVVHTYPTPITGIIVVASAADGSSVTYAVTSLTKTVVLTGSVGVACSYMLIAVA